MNISKYQNRSIDPLMYLRGILKYLFLLNIIRDSAELSLDWDGFIFYLSV